MPRSAAVLARLAAPSSASTPDAQLLRTFVASQGDDAFAELVRRHGPMVLAVCRRVLGDAHDAEDAFQATFLVLARKAGSVRSENVSAWLYGVALRTARGVRVMRDRRRKHSLRSQEASSRSQNDLAPPDSSLALLEQAAIIDEELAKLPDYYREAIVLCELRGLSRQQAATELGVPSGTLSSRLACAKRKLAARLAARGLAGAVALAAILAPVGVSAALLESTSLAVRGAAGGVAGAAASTVMKGMLFEQLRASVLTAVVLVAAVCGGLAMTGAPGSPDAPPAKAGAPDAPRPAEDPAAALVKQLGSDDFATREAAEKELRKLGSKAEAALKAGLKSEDPEIRARCAKILTAIRKDALEALVKTFDPAAENPSDHPIWKRFKAIAGDTRASRELFARVIKNPDWLRRLDAAEAGPDAAAKQYREAILEVGRNFRANMHVYFFIPVWPCDTPDQAAYLLFLGCYAGTESARPTAEAEAHLFSDGEGRVYYARGLILGILGKEIAPGPAKQYNETAPLAPGTDRVFGRLLAAWLPRRTDPDALQNGFRVAVEGGAAEVLPFARKLAGDLPRDRELSMRVRVAALAAVARFGTHADLTLFPVLFEDESVLSPFIRSGANPASTDGAGVVQVRDCAYGLALLLHGEDPVNHGFLLAGGKSPKPGRRPEVSMYSDIDFGFLNGDDKSRTAAHAKAKAFLDKQKDAPKKEEPKPDPAAAKLVKQLGSDDFAEREAAEKQLKELGPKADAALKAGLKSEDPEIRARCAKILADIRKDVLDTLIKGFDPAAEKQPDHPVWQRFKAIAGDTRASRELFARIIANKKWIQTLDNAEANPAEAGHIYRVGVAEVFRDFHNDPAKNPPWPCDRPEEVAYLLFLGSYADIPMTKLVGDEIVPQNLRNTAFLGRGIIRGEEQIIHANGLALGLEGKIRFFNAPEIVGAAGTDRVFAKLFVAWLARHDPASPVVPRGLRVVGRELLPFARRIAANDFEPKREIPPLATITALEMVARFGTRADLPLFERHFGDETNVATADKPRDDGARDYYRSPPVIDTTQLRDVALGLALLLYGNNPADFGFVVREEAFKPVDGRYLVPGSIQLNLGFKSDEDRAAGFKKAKAFLAKQKDEPDPAKLVEQLGSDDFATREAAEKQLKELGSKARGALEAGLKSDNPEVVKRCRELLEHLARVEFETKHWPRFAKVIGDDKASRALFDRIRSQRRNVELLDAVAADPKAAGKLYHDRWAELNKAANIPLAGGGFQLVAAPLADVVGWMYLGTFPGAEGSFHRSSSLDFLPFLPVSKNTTDAIPVALKDETIAVPLRKLVGTWTAARVDYSGREFGFQLAIQFDIKEVLPAARETVATKVKDDPYPGNTARNIARAMLLLGKLGSKDDLPLLEKFATNEDRCAVVLIDPPPKPGQPVFRLYRLPIEGQDVTTQLRDVSVAMRLHLLGQNPDDFGFYWQHPEDSLRIPVKLEGRFNLYSLGFIRNADRTAAHKKAKEWFDKQKK